MQPPATGHATAEVIRGHPSKYLKKTLPLRTTMLVLSPTVTVTPQPIADSAQGAQEKTICCCLFQVNM